ncbi:MAG: acetyl-CoA carboxylase biotin carboxyl carrier protein subunit [Aestuariivita sp.]|nr:acetyl-CoA carboxylase biotin carboxyl carrier protein subunit [Aestuariivita sp.]
MIKIELETGGSVWKILKKAGDKVFAGEVLFILEVMKMEVPYEAPASGEIVEIWFNEGDPVEEGQIAAEIQVS